MRAILLVWLAPSASFWTWHLLASNDIVFARTFHDRVFDLYGQLLGIAPDAIPALFAKAVFTDGLLVLAIFAFRKRKVVADWLLPFLRRLRGRFRMASASVDPARPAG